LKIDIFNHKEEKKRIKEAIPESIVVSIFQVNCKEIRNMYVNKHKNIIKNEKKLIAQKAKEKNYELTTKFDEIMEKIRKPPKDIEELTDIKKYISDIPIEIEKRKKEID